jgi:hypothetical protein
VSPSNATGTVSFFDGITPLGTSTLVNGQATLSTGPMASGVHPLTARYLGDATYLASASPPLQQTVSALPANGFAPALSFDDGLGAVFVAAGDFNGDGRPSSDKF